MPAEIKPVKSVGMMPPERFLIRMPRMSPDVALVRSLKGHRWHPDLKSEGKPWSCEASLRNLNYLKQWGFLIDDSVKKWKKKHKTTIITKKVQHVPGLKASLLPFQQEGVGFLEATNGRCIIGDEMGLGKTLQALAWLQLREDALPTLVVCPSILKENWKSEIRKFTTLKSQILEGSKPYKPKARKKKHVITIINYDVMKDWKKRLEKTGYKTIILDEAHQIKNADAKRTKAVRYVSRSSKHLIALSGTPILNCPSEFFNILNMLDPVEFNSWFSFGMRYCGPTERNGATEFKGASNQKELTLKLKRLMIRRLKRDVLKELPPKIQTSVKLELTPEGRKKYLAAKRKVFLKLPQHKNALAKINAIAGLRQGAVQAKMDVVCEWIDNTMNQVDKLILFVIHKSTTDSLLKRYPEAMVLDGSTGRKERVQIEKDFQTKKSKRLLIANIDVAGMGLNLTAGQAVAFVELPWNPGTRDQGEDRIHRIGQKRKTFIYYLIAKGTIEEDIENLIQRKESVSNVLLNNGRNRNVNETKVMDFLLEKEKENVCL